MIAIVVATKREAAALRYVQGGGASLFWSGAGKVNAAMETMEAICLGAKAVVNAGLAGAVDPQTAVGSAWCVAQAVQYDVDLSAVDGVEAGTVDGRTSPVFQLNTVPCLFARRVGTADRFASGDCDKARLRAMGCGLVDMECAAIAQVCERKQIPLFAVKVVSDAGDADGYNANADRCLAELTRATEIAVGAARRFVGREQAREEAKIY